MTSFDKLTEDFEKLKEKALFRACAACVCCDDVDEVDEAIKHFGELLGLFGSHERPYAFLEFFGDDSSEEYHPDIFWKAFHTSWSGFDAIPHDEFRELFALKRNYWKSSLLRPDDLIFYNSLPETFEAYRGTDANAQYKDGLSWTIDREVAATFARGHRWIMNENPIILTATINKRDIVGAYNDRNEHEIVLFDPPTPHHVEQRIRGKLG